MGNGSGAHRFVLGATLGVITCAVVSVATLAWPAVADQGTGDFNNDCVISEEDFLAFLACRGGPVGGLLEPACWRGDLDGDGDVDLRDLRTFQLGFDGWGSGACCHPDGTCSVVTVYDCLAGGPGVGSMARTRSSPSPLDEWAPGATLYRVYPSPFQSITPRWGALL